MFLQLACVVCGKGGVQCESARKSSVAVYVKKQWEGGKQPKRALVLALHICCPTPAALRLVCAVVECCPLIRVPEWRSVHVMLPMPGNARRC